MIEEQRERQKKNIESNIRWVMLYRTSLRGKSYRIEDQGLFRSSPHCAKAQCFPILSLTFVCRGRGYGPYRTSMGFPSRVAKAVARHGRTLSILAALREGAVLPHPLTCIRVSGARIELATTGL